MKLLLALLALGGVAWAKECRKQSLNDMTATICQGEGFEKLLDEAAKETDAEFCAKATEEWQVKAFCKDRWTAPGCKGRPISEPCVPDMPKWAEPKVVRWVKGEEATDGYYFEIGLMSDGSVRWREAKP